MLDSTNSNPGAMPPGALRRGPARFTRRAWVGLAAAALLLPLLDTPSAAHDKPDVPPPRRSAAAATVTVFAAASLKTALDAIAGRWMAATGHTLVASYGASGSLARQIENGAPADLFAAADLRWMDYLDERKLIQRDSRVSLLGNTLVLIAARDDGPTDLKIEPGFKLAEAIGDSKLATGDPKSVPVGIYAQLALTSLGVWEAVRPNIAGTDNVRTALAFVARGEARLGIVYRTDASSEPRVRIVATFPAGSHPPIVYPFALTTSSTSSAAAEFLAFLKGPEARAAFQSEGFSVLP